MLLFFFQQTKSSPEQKSISIFGSILFKYKFKFFFDHLLIRILKSNIILLFFFLKTDKFVMNLSIFLKSNIDNVIPVINIIKYIFFYK